MDAHLVAIDGITPDLAPDCLVAPGSFLIGRVTIGSRASVWYGCVLRGDDEQIVVGDQSNIQDGSIIHADPGEPTVVGSRVSLGHGAVVHGAVVEDDVLVGIRATVLHGATIGSGSLVAAGAVVRPGTIVPPGSLVAGVPAEIRRPITASERDMIERLAGNYVERAMSFPDRLATSRVRS